MKLFLGGFVAASLLWVGVLWAQSRGVISLFDVGDVQDSDEHEVSASTGDKTLADTKSKKRRGRGRRSGRNRSPGAFYPQGEGMSGDDLGAPGSRTVAMGQGGSEEQLSEAEIDKGIDRVFSGIERCLVLVPSAAPTKGKVIVGMHIASSGQVTKVNLKGPKALIGGEAGACMRRVVKTIRYPSFDGPDMVAHYPITFE